MARRKWRGGHLATTRHRRRIGDGPLPTTLRFVAENDFGSRLIRYFSHGWCSHVDVVWEPGKWLLGARLQGGVQIRPWDYRCFSRAATVTLPTSDCQDELCREFWEQQIDKPYDFLAIAAFAFDRKWRMGNRWYCSELAMRPFEPDISGFFQFMLSTPSHRLTPPDGLLIASAFAPIKPEPLR